MAEQEYTDTKGLEEIFGIAASTWNKRRLIGGDETPPFTKIGRSVRYHIPTVRQWMADRTRRSTSDHAGSEAA
jgi:predicted DNA-binding transcriptional regulator AlpA